MNREFGSRRNLEGRDPMAEPDRQDGEGTQDELDLKSFYRNTLEPARTTESLNIRDFYVREDAPREQAADAAEDVPQPLEGHYKADEWPPAEGVPLPLESHYEPEEGLPAGAADPAVRSEIAGEAPPPAQYGRIDEDTEAPDPALEEPDGTPPAQYGLIHEGSEAPDSALDEPDGLPPAHPEDAFEDDLPEEPPKRNPIARIATIGAGLGVFFGAVVIGLTWLVAKPSGPYDLGTMTSDAAGLRGHLYTKWDEDKLQYRLSFAPSDPDLHKAFALTIDDPPHPLSIGIQLKDAMGFVLCTKEILVKYDPAAVLAAAPPDKSGGPVIDLAQSEAQEKQREQGRDVFQTQNGSDGQIESIGAQGQFPCTEDAYRKVVAWAFTPDFPSLSEQNQHMKEQADEEANAKREEAARKHAAAKRVDRTLTFSIEGDEVLVGYDAPSGALETNSAVEFLVDKQSAPTVLAAWQGFPIHVHYQCDQSSSCTLTRSGGATLHARLRR